MSKKYNKVPSFKKQLFTDGIDTKNYEKKDEKAEDYRNGKKGAIRKRVSANAPSVRSSVLALFIVRSNLVTCF